ncbi:hypothetical protein EYC98_06670 [Halieaceae bacterium IMCC14734]|uniref:Ribbon-helix-helix protein, CopG family n=1 Tax=Candidatus Litorirhabdus singularis TaxID=2518993 RepID=A0ABT3TE35_9GAMM|nr:hypothetical protein [Candidatus Litorirhabdus singularis]MCX2980556.1 hypothetical protein [Candidatus Litorirhabdus singularis]
MAKESEPTKRKRQQTKDRVLQARIPEQLDEELRDRAEELGLSVSTIVRNVLLNTFELVEGVVIDSTHIARALTGRGEATAAPDAEATVIGWQEVTLNQNGICDDCNAILPMGERAAIGVPTGPRAVLLCTSCLTRFTSAAAAAAKPATKKPAKKRVSKPAPAGSKKGA